jgi:glutathione synthase/RimK-type ligase-like ATP-grasp enzyme
MWRSITSLLANRVWVNNHYKMLEAEHKPYQIKVASEVDFDIPDTLITSNPEKAKEFWKYCRQQMVIKTLMLSPMENKVIFTNKVTEELMSKIERLKSSPVILQRIIPKKYELRITVVGENVFPARIISGNKIDWRRSKIKAERYTLPEPIKVKCLWLIKRLGLRYGCIDMIVTPEDQYYFLEINPNGQWEFIEE